MTLALPDFGRGTFGRVPGLRAPVTAAAVSAAPFEFELAFTNEAPRSPTHQPSTKVAADPHANSQRVAYRALR